MVKKGANAALGHGKTSNDKENRPLPNAAAPSSGSDIDKILDFIEGRTQIELAPKKADKRARQRQKKEEERRKREEEALAAQKAEEERLERERIISEQARIREELALQKVLKLKQKKKAAPNNDKGKKTKKSKDASCAKESKELEFDGELFEQTIPAMVTIKRIVENNNAPPTVTITLKGSTPDQDKLLYTLVNGHDSPFIGTCTKEDKSKDNNAQDKQKTTCNDSAVKKKKKRTKEGQESSTTAAQTKKFEPQVQTNEIQVNFAVDKSFRHDMAKLKEAKCRQEAKAAASTSSKPAKTQQVKEKSANANELNANNVAESDIIDIPSLKLPPGITITKVNGPLNSRKANVQSNKYPSIPVSKSGVIVVDTEKLMLSQTGKKKKKKGKKSAPDPIAGPAMNSSSNNARSESRVQILASTSSAAASASASGSDLSGMVKLKNPIFHSLQNKMIAPEDALPHMMDMNEQATISKGENGMVTIRRQRHVGFYASNESSISEYLASKAAMTSATSAPGLAPQEAPREPILTPWQMPDMSIAAMSEENKIIGPKIAQWPRGDHEGGKVSASNVLEGLPGIEITRVKTGSPVAPGEYVEAPADVSIIRTSTFAGNSTKNLT